MRRCGKSGLGHAGRPSLPAFSHSQGQKLKSSRRVNLVRNSPESGHSARSPAGLLGARSGRAPLPRARKIDVALVESCQAGDLPKSFILWAACHRLASIPTLDQHLRRTSAASLGERP